MLRRDPAKEESPIANWIVGGVVALLAGLALRSMYKNKKAGKSCGCSGDCSQCKGCH